MFRRGQCLRVFGNCTARVPSEVRKTCGGKTGVRTWGAEQLSAPKRRLGVTWLGPRSSGGEPWFRVCGGESDFVSGELRERALEPESSTYEACEGMQVCGVRLSLRLQAADGRDGGARTARGDRRLVR